MANFLGASNIFGATCTTLGGSAVGIEAPVFGGMDIPAEKAPNLKSKGAAKLVVRAEKLLLSKSAAPKGVISVPAKVETVDYQGQAVRYFVRAGETQLQAINMIDDHPFAVGDDVHLHLRPQDCAALPG